MTLFAVFWRGGALDDLYQSTVRYNLLYSGETYRERWDMVRYLFTFPIQHARVDALWFAGGLGCLVLLIAGLRRRMSLIPVVWTAAACLSIAINGSRNLPQYFLQAAPALALAAGLGATVALPRVRQSVRWAVIVLVAIGIWRVDDFPKLASNVSHDLAYIRGNIDQRTHLARYGGLREIDKYSALDNADLGSFVGARTNPEETVLVFGFSPAAYVYAGRRSASRFFWSRAVILNFNGTDPRWGVPGLLADLRRNNPAYVVLQRHDWSPDVEDSAPFFMAQPALAGWLLAGYHRVPIVEGFDGWERNRP